MSLLRIVTFDKIINLECEARLDQGYAKSLEDDIFRR
jgi:hypothetical protein